MVDIIIIWIIQQEPKSIANILNAISNSSNINVLEQRDERDELLTEY